MPDVAFVFTVSHARSIPTPEAVLGCQQNRVYYCKLPVAILFCMRVKRKPVVIYNIIAM